MVWILKVPKGYALEALSPPCGTIGSGRTLGGVVSWEEVRSFMPLPVILVSQTP
jgi:hypothetical protein